MNSNLINTIWLSASFLSLFALAELLYYKFKVQAEYTRKLVHFGTGILTFLFPVFLTSHWWVLLLCSSFAAILLSSFKFKLLQSINGVDRVTWGSLYYPVAVYGCFLAYEFNEQKLILFYLPILILAVCDPLAALAGRRWPLGKYSVKGNQKSFLGSFVFALVAFLICIFFFLNLNLEISKILAYSMIIAITSSGAEALSNKGFDNLSIPATVLGLCLLLL